MSIIPWKRTAITCGDWSISANQPTATCASTCWSAWARKGSAVCVSISHESFPEGVLSMSLNRHRLNNLQPPSHYPWREVMLIDTYLWLHDSPRFFFRSSSVQIHGPRAMRPAGPGVLHSNLRQVEEIENHFNLSASLGRGQLLRSLFQVSKTNQSVQRHHRINLPMVSDDGKFGVVVVFVVGSGWLDMAFLGIFATDVEWSVYLISLNTGSERIYF